MTNPDTSILKVRRSIHIKAAPARVWQAFASKARMDEWWGLTKGTPEAGTSQGQWLTAYEPRLGGRIEMAVMWDGTRVSYGGVITVFAAAKELTFENDWIPNRGWAAPTFITLRVTAALGGSLVELFHHGFERTGGDVGAEHAGYETGWGMMQLSALKEIVEAGRG
jgi:uncharacterized protein YndB with AHSA1/START domain